MYDTWTLKHTLTQEMLNDNKVPQSISTRLNYQSYAGLMHYRRFEHENGEKGRKTWHLAMWELNRDVQGT